MSIPVDILAFIGILGAAVVLHEFGHFIVAKLFKIRVETFSFGFGPRLLGVRVGPTDYRVSLVPLGGYVKLGGDESNAPLEGEGATDIPQEEMFNLRPRWQRILVALAGPVMNILTAITIPLAAALLYGIPVTPAPVVSAVSPGGTSESAGLRPGDRIVSFNGRENPRWDHMRGDALLSPGRQLPMVVERNGERVTVTITPSTHTEDGETFGLLDFSPDYGQLPVIVRDVQPNTPAAEAGLKVGDRILAVGGQEVSSAEHTTQMVRDHKEEPVTLTVERDGQRLDIVGQARRLDDGNVRLGFRPDEQIPYQQAGMIAATGYAIRANIEILRLTGKALGQLFTGERSARNTLAGPIGIYRAASTSVERLGWAGFFAMLGFLSLNLGIFNLLPIPVLDGGAIFLLLIESALAMVGLQLSATLRDRIQQIGFVMVILLMVFVITNDLIKQASIWRGSGGDPPAASEPVK